MPSRMQAHFLKPSMYVQRERRIYCGRWGIPNLYRNDLLETVGLSKPLVPCMAFSATLIFSYMNMLVDK